MQKPKSRIVTVLTAAPNGADSLKIEMEIQVGGGLPGFVIVGLPDASVQEARERVRSAIRQSGFEFPRGRIVINIAPAHVKKEGSHYDLPMALGILMASGQWNWKKEEPLYAFGELTLSGKLRSIPNAFALIGGLEELDSSHILVPAKTRDELRNALQTSCLALESLAELHGSPSWERLHVKFSSVSQEDTLPLLEEVRGQHQAKMALLISAAGAHNLILAGPPGCGKTMLAQRLGSLLPDLEDEESQRVSRIHSISGGRSGLIRRPPIRMVHASIPKTGLIGGGPKAAPGEITLAHSGVLVMDELLEFQAQSLEGLRQPISDGYISHSRLKQTLKWPARFQIVATLNPCICGYFGSMEHTCTCPKSSIKRYQSRLSGPLEERMDLGVFLQPSSALLDTEESRKLSTSYCRRQVLRARNIQKNRFENQDTNATGCIHRILESGFCARAREKLQELARRENASARKLNSLIRVARTIADLQDSPQIEMEHAILAQEYRRQLWKVQA